MCVCVCVVTNLLLPQIQLPSPIQQLRGTQNCKRYGQNTLFIKNNLKDIEKTKKEIRNNNKLNRLNGTTASMAMSTMTSK